MLEVTAFGSHASPKSLHPRIHRGTHQIFANFPPLAPDASTHSVRVSSIVKSEPRLNVGIREKVHRIQKGEMAAIPVD
jgi:hypothetical protein